MKHEYAELLGMMKVWHEEIDVTMLIIPYTVHGDWEVEICGYGDYPKLRELLASEARDANAHYERLGEVGPLTMALAAPQTPSLRRLPGIQHLETPIRAALRPGVGILDAVAALHPTPALGGRPRTAALQFIATHEPHPRGWYASPIGMLRPNGEGTMVAAIRSALLSGENAWLYAGAGIVRGSVPEEEWEETGLKFAAVERALFTD